MRANGWIQIQNEVITSAATPYRHSIDPSP
jgi:hypothetical protein